MVNKTVNLTLVGLDGNAVSLMGAFQRQARLEGWTKEEIKQVLDECMSGDYDHLLATLQQYCEPNDEKYDDYLPWEPDWLTNDLIAEDMGYAEEP